MKVEELKSEDEINGDWVHDGRDIMLKMHGVAYRMNLQARTYGHMFDMIPNPMT